MPSFKFGCDPHVILSANWTRFVNLQVKRSVRLVPSDMSSQISPFMVEGFGYSYHGNLENNAGFFVQVEQLIEVFRPVGWKQ